MIFNSLVKKLVILSIPIIFFIVAIFTLKDYGINWDEPFHYFRGQAYFQYLTTGETNYNNISGRRSYFQNDSYSGEYFLRKDSAHPPANDILASLFNFIFYKKLNVLGDIDSYHLFIVLTSVVGVLVVSLFAYEAIGFVGAIVSGLSLILYPLFFAESHFNIKDPVEMTFFTITIWAFWKSLQKGNWKWLFLSLVSCGLALGTKFNIVFLPFIILPYVVVRYLPVIIKTKKWFRKIPISYKICLVLSPVIVSTIFIYLWPFLWKDTISNFVNAVLYYKDIGTGSNVFPGYLLLGRFNAYPLVWILATTPPWTLILFILGLASLFIKRKDNDKIRLLWLLWFMIPVVRVVIPGSSIYGGVRQILEYIPAMALIAGSGAKLILDFISPKFKKIVALILMLLFVPQIIILINIHPNENVYFNSLIGGLSGAREKQIPFWGNSYGNVYLQTIKWVNNNVEYRAKLGLVQGTGINVPKIQLRDDIDFSNGYWSAIFRKGEYLMEMTFDARINPYPYVWEYVEKMLDPVYEVKVDGVPIAKVWKNDIEHTKKEYKKSETKITNYQYSIKDNYVNVVFSNEVIMTRFFLHYANIKSCLKPQAEVQTSIDGQNWITEQDRIPVVHVSVDKLPINTVPFFFAGRDTKYLRIVALDRNSCLLNVNSLDIWSLE